LAQVLRPLQEFAQVGTSDEVLVGLEVADDAAAFQVSDDLAVVVTLDFFTPIVDDPHAYGAIAAANSLSDIYAMGAQPVMALNIAGMPKKLPHEIIREIFHGGAEKAREAGIMVAGGHTVRDEEPKYGLVVIGTIHPSKLKTKGGAQPGDRLLLSKPLGAGVVTTALMQDKASAEELEAVTRSMLQLNREAAQVAQERNATALTDVTGFGLLGHLAEMAKTGDIGFELNYSQLPWLPGVMKLAKAQVFPGGAHDNREYFGNLVRFDAALEEWQRTLGFSPETSGGLLMTLPPESARSALETATEMGLSLVEIGRAVPDSGIRVSFRA